MNKNIFYMFISVSSILISIMVFYPLFSSNSSQYQEEAFNESNTVPDFKFMKLNGKVSKLSNYKGKVIVINFWASWCTPCMQEMPHLLSIADKFKDRMILLLISVDTTTKKIDNFIQNFDQAYKMNMGNKPNVIIAWDNEGKITQDIFQTLRFPETYIIAPDMTIISKLIGSDQDWKKIEKQIGSIN